MAPALGELLFLVVEDHGLQRWAIDNMLRALGASHVLAAASAKAAARAHAASDDPIDIVVWDLDMPGMDVMEFARSLEPGALPSFILLTSLKHSLVAPLEATARASGVTVLATIEKPVVAEKLAGAIKAYAGTSGRPNHTADA
jgi:CheY-like chemotaxis protein